MVTVERLHEVSFPLQITGSFLFFRDNCYISHRTYCQETRCYMLGVGVGCRGIINKDLINILYPSKCLECQTFCVSSSLFTDQKIQKVTAPFSSVNSAHLCLKCYESIYAKMFTFSNKKELFLEDSVVRHVKGELYKICVQKSIIPLVCKCQYISTRSYSACACRFNDLNIMVFEQSSWYVL